MSHSWKNNLAIIILVPALVTGIGTAADRWMKTGPVFFSYEWQKGDKFGFGNVMVQDMRFPPTVDQITALQTQIGKTGKVDQVVVLSFSRVR